MTVVSEPFLPGDNLIYYRHCRWHFLFVFFGIKRALITRADFVMAFILMLKKENDIIFLLGMEPEFFIFNAYIPLGISLDLRLEVPIFNSNRNAIPNVNRTTVDL